MGNFQFKPIEKEVLKEELERANAKANVLTIELEMMRVDSADYKDWVSSELQSAIKELRDLKSPLKASAAGVADSLQEILDAS